MNPRIPLAEHVAAATHLLDAQSRVQQVALSGELVGRIAMSEARAECDVPSADNSQMDGFAVRVADLEHHEAGLGRALLPDGATETDGASVTMPQAPLIAAGDAPGTLPAGHAAPIMTGAPMPNGADAVIPVEETSDGAFPPAGSPVTFTAGAVEPGRFVRRRGSDTRSGDLVLRDGDALTPGKIAHLAAGGTTHVRVVRPWRAAVISTGSEIAASGTEAAPGGALDANGPGLTASLSAMGVHVVDSAVVPDDPAALLSRIRKAITANGAELIVSSGGVSKGTREAVRMAAKDPSVHMEFSSIAMQPGGPQGLGAITAGDGHVPWLAFPGNPVSALLSCELIARPALGAPAHLQMRLPVHLEAPESSPPHLAQYRRARIEPDGHVRFMGGPSSHLIGSLGRANALVIVPIGTDVVHDGDELDTMVLSAP